MPDEHFNRENSDFEQLASAAMLYAKFHAGARKSPSDFWPPLFERPIKFVLTTGRTLPKILNTHLSPGYLFGRVEIWCTMSIVLTSILQFCFHAKLYCLIQCKSVQGNTMNTYSRGLTGACNYSAKTAK